MFAEQKVERGDGPVKIRAALAERGVDPDRIATALAPFEDQWCERARAALTARYGDDAPAGRAEHGRRARFLQSRGFPSTVVARALGRAADE